MTVERQYGVVNFCCDGKRCAQVYETEHNNFMEALEELKEADWSVRNIKGEWLHVCPDCQEAENALAL